MSVFLSKINVNSEAFQRNRVQMLELVDKLTRLNARGAALSEKRKPRFEEGAQKPLRNAA